MLLERETFAGEEGREGGIDMEQYQQCIATGLEQAGLYLNMGELFILKDIEDMKKSRKAALKSKSDHKTMKKEGTSLPWYILEIGAPTLR